MDKETETALVRSAQGGDAAAFERLLRFYYEPMFKMAFRFCGERSMAEDITQEACIKVARAMAGFRHDCAFSSWLYRLVINTGKDMARSRQRHQGDANALEHISVPAAADTAAYAGQVLRAVDTLPEGEKEALMLVAHAGLSHRQAAEVLGCSESTVSWRIHEGRKKLHKILGQKEPVL